MGEVFSYTWVIFLLMGMAFAALAGWMLRPEAGRVTVLLAVLPLLFGVMALLIAIDQFIVVPTMLFLALTIIVCFAWGVRLVRYSESGKKASFMPLVGVIVCALSVFAVPVLLTQRQETVLARSLSTVMSETFTSLGNVFRGIDAERRK